MTEADQVSILPITPGAALSREQSQRVSCLALALLLVRGRSVHINAVRALAEWLYSGADHDRNASS